MTRERILVTGGCGNVGSALVRGLASDSSYEVVVADDLSTGRMKNLQDLPTDNLRIVRLDVNETTELGPLMSQMSFDYVFHYAAVVGVQRTLENPLKVFRDIDGIRNILNLCRSTGVKRVFYSSSSEVYGEPFEIPSSEFTTPLNSRLPYAIVKNLSESYLRTYQQEFGLEYTIFRFFNTYGPRQTTDFVVPKLIQQAIDGEPLTIYGDGLQTRTFCFVEDNVETQIACLKHDKMINGTINIGSDQEMTILDLANEVIRVTNSSSKVHHLPALKEGDMTRRCPDITQMRDILDRELVSLEDGIKATELYLRGIE